MNINYYLNNIDGYCYKNDDAYLNKTEEICYIGENDLLDLSELCNENDDLTNEELIANGYAHNYNSLRNEIKEFLNDNKDCPYTLNELTDFIYEKAEWASISTYLTELDW